MAPHAIIVGRLFQTSFMLVAIAVSASTGRSRSIGTEKTLMAKANSWYMSANIPGKPRAFLPYLDPEGVGGYRKRCDEIATL